MIKKVIQQFILMNTSITSQLATYEFTSGVAAPAIFTGFKIPDDAEYPAIFISSHGGADFGTRKNIGSEFAVDVNIYDDKEQSMKDLDLLSMQLWEYLHRAHFDSIMTAEGYTNWGCIAGSPMDVGGVNTFPGRLIRLTARALKI
ncbi:MAG: hypothetical protein DRQ46_00230 [Gammaproteobacteria bacterium]|nr:MAG: hypothetical protein DRQ46_00230 [Gammaproteobacteria bacterium]